MLNNHAKPSSGKCLTFFQRKLLQKSLHPDLPESYCQRIQIMLLADEGKSQTDICQTLGCCPTTARHWMLVARTGMAHQWQDHPIGRPKVVNDLYLERLKELVSNSPRDYDYPFRRWTGNWLSQHLAKEFGVEVNERHINRLLKQMGLSTRRQSGHVGDNTPEKTTPSRISIQNLRAENLSNSSILWPINLAKLESDL